MYVQNMKEVVTMVFDYDGNMINLLPFFNSFEIPTIFYATLFCIFNFAYQLGSLGHSPVYLLYLISIQMRHGP